jgi:hypothetical protein
MGRFNDANVAKLLAKAKVDPQIEVTMAPRITISPGQTASVSDASTRAFVVGMNRVEGDFALAHQPVIQPIEEGTMLKLRATGENGQIRLDADLALSVIESVGTYDYADLRQKGPDAGSEKGAQKISVQVPEQKLKQVHLSTLVKQGETIFIDPVFNREVESPAEPRINRPLEKNADAKKIEARVLLMIKPRWVEAN